MFFLLLVRMSFYQTEGEGTTPAFKSPVEALSVKLGKEKQLCLRHPCILIIPAHYIRRKFILPYYHTLSS